MESIKNCFDTVISIGNYVADELVQRIDKMFIEGKLTEEERDALVISAYENARDQYQIDVVGKLAELEERIYALEHPVTPDYPIYVPGYVTKKGETVKFDYNDDGVYDLLRYDGGKAETALSPGKISGWHVVDENGEILGTYYKGEFTPVNPEPEESDQTEPGEGE